MKRITFRGVVSAALLTLIALYGISSSGNIILLVSMFHESWVAWTLGGGLGFTLVITSFVAATARTPKLFRSAILIAMAAGLMSASFQTHIYLLDGAPTIIAYVLGFGIPLIGEVGLALLDAHYREEHETLTDDRLSTQLSVELSEVKDALQQAMSDVAAVQAELEATGAALADAKTELAERDKRARAAAVQAAPVQTQAPQGERLGKTERQAALLDILAQLSDPDDIDKNRLADMFGASTKTIGRDIDDLTTAGRLSVNGHIQVF